MVIINHFAIFIRYNLGIFEAKDAMNHFSSRKDNIAVLFSRCFVQLYLKKTKMRSGEDAQEMRRCVVEWTHGCEKESNCHSMEKNVDAYLRIATKVRIEFHFISKIYYICPKKEI
jgi:hypothetical protein